MRYMVEFVWGVITATPKKENKFLRILIEIVCDKCGHEDYEYKEIVRDGEILYIYEDSVVNINNGFTVVDEKVDKNGMTICVPCMGKIKPVETETVVRIKTSVGTISMPKKYLKIVD